MITEEEENIVLLWLHSRKRKRMWVHDLNVVRPQRGEYSNLCRELYSYEDRFYIYFRMSPALFEELHSLICHKINKKDTNCRKAITTKERLAVSLRYLGTGDSFQMIALSHRIGRSTLHNIIKEVCKAIWEILQPIYIPTPTQRTWIIAETGYRQKWKFPNCIGSIDGKHVTIKCPQRSGSLFYCYKSKFSIVLLAVVDPDYKFTYVNVGSYGKDSDSKVFENSEFFRKLVNNELHIPPPKPLPGGTTNLPHVFIGDEGFALQTYLMRPFPRNQAENNGEKANFNKRLSSARRIVENAFGILAHKWRVFFRPLETKVDTTVHIVKAACCLHNYLRVKNELFEMQTPEETMPRNSAFRTINNNTHRARNEAYNVRNCFMNYFND